MNRTPRGLKAKDYAKGQSEFEKVFSNSCDKAAKREGALWALKWIESLHGQYPFKTMDTYQNIRKSGQDEIDALEKD